MRKLRCLAAGACLLALMGCGSSGRRADATGTFESTEIIVSAEEAGPLVRFVVEEGQSLSAGQSLGSIDSTQLVLKKGQLEASRSSVSSRRSDVDLQISALEEQIETQKNEKRRVERLLSASAANQKQLDDVNAQISILERQLEAQKTSLNNANRGVQGEGSSLDFQIAQLDDQIARCEIRSPVAGTVLAKYAEAGEYALPGQALFKVADLSTVYLRAYIGSDLLTTLKIGQAAKVKADFGKKETRSYDGRVVSIADQAEFTPKTAQTRDERDNLVYAVKIAVKNDGYLKIGMYGSVEF
jgi:HlyD family secretion protein